MTLDESEEDIRRLMSATCDMENTPRDPNKALRLALWALGQMSMVAVIVEGVDDERVSELREWRRKNPQP